MNSNNFSKWNLLSQLSQSEHKPKIRKLTKTADKLRTFVYSVKTGVNIHFYDKKI